MKENWGFKIFTKAEQEIGAKEAKKASGRNFLTPSTFTVIEVKDGGSGCSTNQPIIKHCASSHRWPWSQNNAAEESDVFLSFQFTRIKPLSSFLIAHVSLFLLIVERVKT